MLSNTEKKKNLSSSLNTQLRGLEVKVWQTSVAIFTSTWFGGNYSEPGEEKLALVF